MSTCATSTFPLETAASPPPLLHSSISQAHSSSSWHLLPALYLPHALCAQSFTVGCMLEYVQLQLSVSSRAACQPSSNSYDVLTTDLLKMQTTGLMKMEVQFKSNTLSYGPCSWHIGTFNKAWCEWHLCCYNWSQDVAPDKQNGYIKILQQHFNIFGVAYTISCKHGCDDVCNANLLDIDQCLPHVFAGQDGDMLRWPKHTSCCKSHHHCHTPDWPLHCHTRCIDDTRTGRVFQLDEGYTFHLCHTTQLHTNLPKKKTHSNGEPENILRVYHMIT